MMKIKLLITMALVQIASIIVAMDNATYLNEPPSVYAGLTTQSLFGESDLRISLDFSDHGVGLRSSDFLEQYNSSTVSDQQKQEASCELTQLIALADYETQGDKFSEIKTLVRKKRKRENGNDRPFICDRENCGQLFRWKEGLEFHIKRTHEKGKSKEKSLICHMCLKQFSTNRHLKNHMKLHERDKEQFPCECTTCTMRFRNENLLKKHLKANANVCAIV